MEEENTTDVSPPLPTSSLASNSSIVSIHEANLETVEAAIDDDDDGGDIAIEKERITITSTLILVSIFSAFGGFVFGYDLGLMGYVN